MATDRLTHACAGCGRACNLRTESVVVYHATWEGGGGILCRACDSAQPLYLVTVRREDGTLPTFREDYPGTWRDAAYTAGEAWSLARHWPHLVVTVA